MDSATEGDLLPAGTYWCNVVSYHDHSGILAAYGPYRTQQAAERAGTWLRHAGVHDSDLWESKPLHLLFTGARLSDAAAADVPLLLAAIEAALKLADPAKSTGVPPVRIREAITTELTGKDGEHG